MASTPQSRKAKGRRLQKKVMKLFLEAFDDLDDDDVDWTSMGAGGEDILLSPKAQERIPFSFECKNTERLNIWKALEQADANATEIRPGAVIFKRNYSDIYCTLRLEDFIQLLVDLHTKEGELDMDPEDILEFMNKLRNLLPDGT